MKNIFLKSLLIIGMALLGVNSAYADFSFNDMELKFAQISDVHLSDAPDTTYKVLSHSKDLLKSAIQDVNKMKGLDFVVFTGDMVNEPTKEYYREFLTSLTDLKHSALFVFGNHDAYQDTKNGEFLTKSEVFEILRKSNPYQNYGKPYFAYSPNAEYRVIVLDTTVGHEGSSNGTLPQDQMEFLDNEIRNNQDKIIIIFQHHPVIEPFKSADHMLLNSDDYMAILKQYEKTPIAIFTGHYHAARIVQKGNILHVVTPSLVTYPNAFRTVKITNYEDRVIFNIKLNETKLLDVQQESKAGLIASAAFLGLPTDRNAEITLKKGVVPKETLSRDEINAQRIIEKERKKAEKEAIKAEKRQAKETKKQMKKLEKEVKNSTFELEEETEQKE